MMYMPEVAPLLNWNQYDIRISFILPVLLNKYRKENKIDHVVTVHCFQSGQSEPTDLHFEIPNCEGNHNYSLSLSSELQKTSLNPHKPAYVVIESKLVTEAKLPPVLKTLGHWVSYGNEKTYMVIPSGVQFASTRLNYGSASDAILVDYFGVVAVNEVMSTHIALMNPYIGESDVEVQLRENNKIVASSHHHLPPFSMVFVETEPMLKEKGIEKVSASLKIISTHRTPSFVLFFDKKNQLYYSADHTIPWINR